MRGYRINRRRTRAVMAVSVGLLLVACASTPQASAPFSPVVDTSERPSPQPTGTTAPSTSTAPSSPPSDAPQPSLVADAIARLTADGVRVRRDPGPDGDHIATLDAGTRVFVLDGPSTDPSDTGLDWWLVAPYMCEDGCGYEPRIGWVSSGPAGDWLEPLPLDCRSSYTVEDRELFYAMPEWLACHGGEPITFEGTLDYWCCSALTVAEVEPRWLVGEPTSIYPMLRGGSDTDYFSWGPVLRVNPDSAVSLGERGTVGRYTGHFDDPAAQSCVATIPDDVLRLNPQFADTVTPGGSVYACRLQFVVDSVEVLDFIPLPTHPPQG